MLFHLFLFILLNIFKYVIISKGLSKSFHQPHHPSPSYHFNKNIIHNRAIWPGFWGLTICLFLHPSGECVSRIIRYITHKEKFPLVLGGGLTLMVTCSGLAVTPHFLKRLSAALGHLFFTYLFIF